MPGAVDQVFQMLMSGSGAQVESRPKDLAVSSAKALGAERKHSDTTTINVSVKIFVLHIFILPSIIWLLITVFTPNP